MLNMVQNDEKIQKINKNTYKQMIRKSIKNAALRYLTKKQESHSKINMIKYSELETQKYMISPIF